MSRDLVRPVGSDESVWDVLGLPQWYHHHGNKLVVKDCLPQEFLSLSGSAAFLTITRYDGRDDLWRVEWRVVQSRFEFATGCVIMNIERLKSAFGLPCDPDRYASGSAWLLGRYDADAASQRHFIRKGPYLNIPCPGTGHDGDPNISIFVDEQIQNAVRTLLAV